MTLIFLWNEGSRSVEDKSIRGASTSRKKEDMAKPFIPLIDLVLQALPTNRLEADMPPWGRYYHQPKFFLDEKASYALKTGIIMAVCFFCQKGLTLEGKVSFRELCPHCGMDVHVCRNCEFFDPGRANNCREPMAEKVRDPELRNTCEYFTLAQGGASGPSDADKAKAALENLFKKK